MSIDLASRLRKLRRVRVLLAAVLAVAGCDSNAASLAPATASRIAASSSGSVSDGTSSPALVDLSASLDAARGAFNARQGEARFLTLLSPV
jgi:hypothetical protein